ncbi:MAG: DUF1993 domain-containing protein [Sphingopyxis sp.]|uniref:DUF1993 domain-containing protein n=1 Tax=Sphingopyxis sp. TaxID=1908224 RepID=UPI002ABC5C1B|nr:DUF1993 domain-containing protein [Sphingopyxis sp.]MDZ3830327.1 DUF1993 domain-containing protein [Sphingopyxis sp.]
MLYDQTISAYAPALRALSTELGKAAAWAQTNDIGELQFAAARLAPDMYPLSSQVRFTCLQALQPLARLADMAVPEFPDDASDFAGMQAQIAGTLAFLDGVAPAELGDDGDRAVGFTLPNGMAFDMTAASYVRDWANPQFYFHRVAAYAVMRHMGVPLGKADYVNYMMQYLRPGTAPAA